MTRALLCRPGRYLGLAVWLTLALVFAACDDDPAGEADTGPDLVDDADTGGDAPVDLVDDSDGGDQGADLEPDVVEDADVGVDADTSIEPDAPDLGLDGVDLGADQDAGAPECSHACDCAQGYDCVADRCELGATAVLCCTQPGCVEGDLCLNPDDSSGLCGVENSSLFGEVIFNEVLSDGETDGDPNGDGDAPDAAGDEFVEIVNMGSSSVDLDGFTLVEQDLPIQPRHSFGSADSIPAGEALVIFGGGTAPDDITGASYLVADSIPPGLLLDNAGDSIRLFDGDGKLVAIYAWGDGTPQAAITDESATRSPDLTGEMAPHSTATGSEGRLFSPGTRLDGTTF